MKRTLQTVLRTLRSPMLAGPQVLLMLVGMSFFVLSANEAYSATHQAGNTGQPLSTELPGGWHFVRTPNPQGGADAISIMHTADISRSDLDLAGMMIRCRNGNTEALIILLRPFPLHARPQVVLGKPGNETHFEATVAAPGTAILITKNATDLVSGPWQSLGDLFIRIGDGPSAIRGVVSLTDLQPAFKLLTANCFAQ